MAWMMSIRLDSQVSLLARWDEDGWVHLGIGMVQSGVIAAPRLALSFATRLWALHPSRLMAAPGLGSLLATWLWTFWSSRLMIVALRLGTFGATPLWTWGLLVHFRMRMHTHCLALLPTELWAALLHQAGCQGCVAHPSVASLLHASLSKSFRQIQMWRWEGVVFGFKDICRETSTVC